MFCLHTGAASAIPVHSDAEVVAKAAKEVGTGQHNFVWAQLHGLAELYESRAARRGAGPAVHDVPATPAPRSASRPPSAASAPAAASPFGGSPAHAIADTPAPSPAAPARPETPVLEATPGKGSDAGEMCEDGGTAAAEEPPPPVVDEAALLDAALRQIDAHVGSVYSSLPPNSMLVVFTGQGDTSGMRKFQVRVCCSGRWSWFCVRERALGRGCV